MRYLQLFTATARNTIPARVTRLVVAVALVVISATAIGAAPASANDEPTGTTEMTGIEWPALPPVDPALTAGAEMVASEGGEFTRDCNPAQGRILIGFFTPQRDVQAYFDIQAQELPGSDTSVGAKVTYRNSRGQEFGPGQWWARPVVAFGEPVPLDARGVDDIVTVMVEGRGDPRNFSCNVTVTSKGALPIEERWCFSMTEVVVNWPTPLAAVQPSIHIELGSRARSSTFVEVKFTNPSGSEASMHTTVGPKTDSKVLLPADGRGVYNVVRFKYRVADVSWYNLLQCEPWITNGEFTSDAQQACFNGRVVIPNRADFRVLAAVALTARRTTNGVVYADYRLSNGNVVGYHQLVGVGENLTIVRLPKAGVANVEEITVRVAVDWTALLACSARLSAA